MAFDTFTPPGLVNVSPGSSVAYQPRVNRAPFGDGYSQRSGDGLNANPAAFDASFENLTRAEAKTVCDFFKAKKGYIPFLWTKPGDVAATQWIAKQWRETYTGPNMSSVSAAFEQTFDP